MVSRPTVDFDHYSPEFAADPAAAFRELREQCPVAWSDQHGGFWIPTRHADVATVSRDDATYSSDRLDDPDSTAIIIPRFPSPVRNVPIEMDPPEFNPYRRILNPVMSPQAVETELRPLLEDLADYCVDRVIEQGECDMVIDLASPVPSLFTLIWLGLPTDDWERFADIQHSIVANPPDSPEFERARDGMGWQLEVIQETIAAKRAHPANDLMSYFISQQVDGHPLSDQRVLEMVSLVIAGGVDTTTSLTGQALMWLHDKPEVRAMLVDDPDALELATEEFLRFFCPVTTLARTVVKDTELGGQQLHPGERIMLPWYAANRDPDVFPDPDDVVLDRYPNRHTSFGLGIHRCAGSNLARVSFRSLLTTILRRMPDYVIDSSRAKFYPAIGTNTGWSKLPATFTPGTRNRAGSELPTL